MGDEEDLMERERALNRDRLEQAKWYESLNLYAEAMRIYRSLEDDENLSRLRSKIADQYSMKAKDMENVGRWQDAANLYYLIGDSVSVDRMRSKDPDLVILYDDKAGGLSQLGFGMDMDQDDIVGERFFKRPNEDEPQGSEPEITKRSAPSPVSKTGLPVRMPAKRTIVFCPYCGERIQTKKEPKFCPSCGEEL
ncbi:MAG: hypothetical protein QCI82_11030 [Candidatus Thermoplasmatota archaeon]|nr:hypothetical protein [Candidatus Thermoplasmatota archaeon]